MEAHQRVFSVFFLLLLFVAVGLCTLPVISVKNGKIFLNSQEFVVKGVDYSPTPIGASSTNFGTGYGGGGFCSSKLTPWGEYKSACYDSDYFDGSTDIDPTRFPNGFLPIWQRDFPQIKAIGANTIRLYNINPSTKAASQTYTNLFPYAQGKDHTQFMKYCEQNGIYVVYPLLADQNMWNNLDERTYKRYLRWQIDEVGNSSALLMWQIGNEMGWSWGNSAGWNTPPNNNKLNDYLNYARRYTMSKWGRFIPVTSAAVNIVTDYNYQFSTWQVDIFSANVFMTNFNYLFVGATDGSFDGVAKLSCRYNKPYMMSELYSTPAQGQGYAKGTFNQIWQQVVQYYPEGLIGAIWFEQTDEPALGKDSGFWSLQVSTLASGQSNQANVIIPDNIAVKQQFYDAVNGTYNGQPYNMATDFLRLLGRSAYTLSNAPDICASYNLKDCPGTSLPYCSGNGACDRSTGTCTCATGWSGANCSVATCPNNCNGQGVCSTIVTPPECVCNAGYYNTSCELTVASVPAGQCPNGCTNGNGVCTNTLTGSYICACWPGWTGPDCAVHDVGKGSVSVQQYYVGCYAATAAPQVANFTSTVLTNQNCRYYCAARNHAYAYTRGGNTCFCADTFSPRVASGLPSACSTLCSGDSQQTCGAPVLTSLYQSGGLLLTGYRGCYPDNSTSRDLSVRLYSGSSNTVDSCRQLCASSGYTYAGVQSGTDCYCGNTFGTKGAKVADSQCSSVCSADNTVNCGGSLKNSIYTAVLPAGYAYH